MNAIRSLLTNVRGVLSGAGGVVRYALIFLRAVFCPKAVLAARLLAAEMGAECQCGAPGP
jgi:hypothetical protein